MRRMWLAATSAALVMTSLAAGGRAAAFETVIGGLAGACSSAAKEGLHDSHSVDICTQALDREFLDPHDLAGTHVNRAAMELLNNDWEAAHTDFDRALLIFPKMGEAHIGLGVYMITMERWPEAEAEVNQGLDLGSEEPEKGYYFRGIARWGQDNFKGAYLDLHKASELKPDWALPRQQLANFHVQPAP